MFIVSVLAMSALVVSCGGGGDDDDDDGGGGSGSSGNNASTSKNDSNADGKLDVKVPQIKEGNFGTATVHVEVSGDKSFKADMEGNGIVLNGLTLINFSNQDATVVISFQQEGKSTAGAVSITGKEVVTGGEWGTQCSVTADDSAKELKGTFECKKVKGIAPTSTKDYNESVKGNFTATR
jgi:hypothetical protein